MEEKNPLESESIKTSLLEAEENSGLYECTKTVEVQELYIGDESTFNVGTNNTVQISAPGDLMATDSISEAGRFALAAICAVSLQNLFENQWDQEFCVKSIQYILANFQLPKRVEPLMLELLKGNVGNSTEPYVALLYSESYFQNENNIQNIFYNFITLAVHEGKYDARWRVLIQHLAKLFNIKSAQIAEFEQELISCLLDKAVEFTEDEKSKAANRKLTVKAKRYAWISLATIGGGALLGVTGGLVAPLIGVGLSNFLGASAIFTAFSSVTGATVIGSLFGVAGGGLTGYKMHKRVGDIEEFEFHELNLATSKLDANTSCPSLKKPKELHVTIVISGWIKNTNETNYTKPWSNLFCGKEQYYLKYESNYLLELGKAMDYILSFVQSFAIQEVLKLTMLSGLVSAISWPAGLLGLASIIDNPWGVCLRRSAQVGKQLAEVLLSRNQGHRPVTLLGYSLGARVIYYCLREMSDRKNCEGIIQDVILIGAPCTAQANEWTKFTRVVAGRIVNGYCRGDWLLRFLYRTLSVAVDGVAGLQEIELDNHKMCNVDLTNLVTGHSDYPERMTEILSYIGMPLAATSAENESNSRSTELVPSNEPESS